MLASAPTSQADPPHPGAHAAAPSNPAPSTPKEAPSQTDSTGLEAEGPIIDRIEWHGLTSLNEGYLEDRIVTTAEPRFRFRFWQPKRRLDYFTLEEDIDRILEAYREVGFFSTKVESRVEGLQGFRAAVHFDVDEGDPILLHAWSLEILEEGDAPDPLAAEERARLDAHIPEAREQPFGSRLYREKRQALMNDCLELGFPNARLKGGAQVDPEAETARIAWKLHVGPRVLVRAITYEGLDAVEEKILRREMRLAPGDRFSASKVAASERRLIETGLFRSVAIGRGPSGKEKEDAQEVRPPRDRIDLIVRVDEAPPRSLRASIGYGTEDGPRGEVSLAWRNFTGEARHLQMRAFGSLLDAGFEASLSQPYLFRDLARADVSVSALRQSRPGYEAFVTDSAGLLTFHTDAAREGPLTLTIGPGYEFAQITTFEIDLPERERGPRQSIITNWSTVLRYQKVDDLIDPSSGYRFELANEIGGFPIGSDLDYHRWALSLRFYVPTGPLVWAFKAAATTLDPINDRYGSVPLTRRLYSGGTHSIRGFGFQKLGPEDSRNDPVGGLSRMEFGAELRVPIWRQFGLVGFVDAGDVRKATWSWKPQDLRAAAGPGLRIDTPVGPIRFDFAFLLNSPPDTDPWRFHLSVGNAF